MSTKSPDTLYMGPNYFAVYSFILECEGWGTRKCQEHLLTVFTTKKTIKKLHIY